jgi:hypothetical protein
MSTSTSSFPPPGIATATPAGVQIHAHSPQTNEQLSVGVGFSVGSQSPVGEGGSGPGGLRFSVGTNKVLCFWTYVGSLMPHSSCSFLFSQQVTSPIPRGIRSACDFCHTKRIKCRRDEGAPKCQQCTQRGLVCKFSPKEKTGPKPKSRAGSRSPSPEPRRSIKSPIPLPSSASPTHARGNSLPCPRPSTYVPGHNSPMRNKSIDLTSSMDMTGLLLGGSRNVPGMEQLKTEPLTPQDSPTLPAPPMSSSQGQQSGSPALGFGLGTADCRGPQRRNPTELQALETKFLHCYMRTTATLLPFCGTKALQEAMALRKASVNPAAIPSSLEQAQLAAALAIGALMNNDRCADLYHAAARTHLKQMFDGPNPVAAGVLCMLAFYWQYKGEDEKKDIYLQHARMGLRLGQGPVPQELQLVLEHLDYEKQARLRQDSFNLSPNLRALHVVSCLLSDMAHLMDADRGSGQALGYCQQLGECSALMENAAHLELPLLLCYALRAFLLMMLGRGKSAVAVLQKIPHLFAANANIIKALPLSWDASLIASTLSFLLGMEVEYAAMYAAVDAARNSSPATQWTCRLPGPGTPSSQYLTHVCLSSSNICAIICQVGIQTKCGSQSFYYSDLSVAPPPAIRGHGDGGAVPGATARPAPVVTHRAQWNGTSSAETAATTPKSRSTAGEDSVGRVTALSSGPADTPKRRKHSMEDADTSPECASGGRSSAGSVSPARVMPPPSRADANSTAQSIADDVLSSQLEQQLLGFSLKGDSAPIHIEDFRAHDSAQLSAAAGPLSNLGLGLDSVSSAVSHNRTSSSMSEQLFSMLDDAELMNVLDEWDTNDAWLPTSDGGFPGGS